MTRLTKVIGAITALIASVTGLLVALRGDDATPQPITHIIIQEVGDYQQFVDQTDLPQFEHLKGSS